MNRYVYGSSAHKIEDDIYRQTDAAAIEAERIAKENKKAQLRKSFLFKMCAYGIIIFLLAAGTVYSRVLVMQAATTAEQKQDELMKLIETNNKKKIEFEQNIDLKKIEELAITQYGMQRPDNNQTVYVNVVQQDYGEVVKGSGR
ncbi:MAG: cell division protein FtsL [Clostridia bacterium]|nr:cell division protein FtsL [Clostridia bacterium]